MAARWGFNVDLLVFAVFRIILIYEDLRLVFVYICRRISMTKQENLFDAEVKLTNLS